MPSSRRIVSQTQDNQDRVVLSGFCLLQIKPTPRQAGIKSRTPPWLVSSVFFLESFKNVVFSGKNEEVKFVTLRSLDELLL